MGPIVALLVFSVLQIGTLAGVPLDPEAIEKLMNVMHRTKLEQVLKKDDPPGYD